MAGFDPRRHSTVALNISQRQPLFKGSNGADQPLKSYLVGPNRADPPGLSSLKRPETAPVTSSKTAGQKVFNNDAHPRFINPRGKWAQGELPTLIADSQAQALCATDKLSATLPGQHGMNRPIRPVTSVHTYGDISPVATTEYVNDGDACDPVATLRYSSKTEQAPGQSGPAMVETAPYTLKAKPIGSTQARVDSISTFWNRLNGAYNLKINDITRIERLGKNAVPGTPNCRLVGGRWRYLERPVEGDSIYTDFYGRCGDDPCAYYGRRYDMKTNDFSQSRMVEEGDYLKVGASMTGIHAMRTRPGLTLDATIVSGESVQLQTLSPYEIKHARGVHKISEFARMRAS